MKAKLRNQILGLMKKKEFDTTIKILESEDGPVALNMLISCYRLSGKFLKEYEASQRLRAHYPEGQPLGAEEHAYLEDAMKAIAVFERCGLSDYNIQITKDSYPQNKERSDESYPETDFVQEILKKGNDAVTRQLIRQIEENKGSSHEETREGAYLAAAQLYSAMHRYDSAFYHYYQALKLNPNKALYWGFAAHALYRDVRSKQDDPGSICSAYLSGIYGQKAIDLDPYNARWCHYLALSLSLFVSRNPVYIHQVLVEARKALSLCRPEQVSLKKMLTGYVNHVEAWEQELRKQ